MITRIDDFCTYHYAIAVAITITITGAIERVGETFGQAVYNWIVYPVVNWLQGNQASAKAALILTLTITGVVNGAIIGALLGAVIKDCMIGFIVGLIKGIPCSGNNIDAGTAGNLSSRMGVDIIYIKMVS